MIMLLDRTCGGVDAVATTTSISQTNGNSRARVREAFQLFSRPGDVPDELIRLYRRGTLGITDTVHVM